jgi:hypothetical protein
MNSSRAVLACFSSSSEAWGRKEGLKAWSVPSPEQKRTFHIVCRIVRGLEEREKTGANLGLGTKEERVVWGTLEQKKEKGSSRNTPLRDSTQENHFLRMNLSRSKAKNDEFRYYRMMPKKLVDKSSSRQNFWKIKMLQDQIALRTSILSAQPAENLK